MTIRCFLAPLFLAAFTPAQAAPALSGGLTAIGQAATDARLGAAATASADLVADFDLPFGRVTAWIEGSTTVRPGTVAGRVPESNGDAGSVADGDGDGGVQLSELKLAVPGAGGATVTAGLIDPSSYLDQSRIANDENTQFLAANFVKNPTVGFPDYTLGLVYERVPSGDGAAYTALLSSSHGIADTAGRAYDDLLRVTDDERGVFAALAAGWRAGEARTRAGAWINTSDHARLRKPGAEANYGLYVLHGVRSGADAFSVRCGIANARVSVAWAYAAAAWQRQHGRALLGLGAAAILVSPHAPAPAADGMNAELYLRWRAAPGLFVTPSLQYFHHPALDGSGATAERDLGIANLRLSWIW